jgi:hypothetical protein
MDAANVIHPNGMHPMAVRSDDPQRRRLRLKQRAVPWFLSLKAPDLRS